MRLLSSWWFLMVQADLLELIVCGNIVGLDIPVRVVQHELWRPHILETAADDYSSDCDAEVGSGLASPWRSGRRMRMCGAARHGVGMLLG